MALLYRKYSTHYSNLNNANAGLSLVWVILLDCPPAPNSVCTVLIIVAIDCRGVCWRPEGRDLYLCTRTSGGDEGERFTGQKVIAWTSRCHTSSLSSSLVVSMSNCRSSESGVLYGEKTQYVGGLLSSVQKMVCLCSCERRGVTSRSCIKSLKGFIGLQSLVVLCDNPAGHHSLLDGVSLNMSAHRSLGRPHSRQPKLEQRALPTGDVLPWSRKPPRQ